MPRTCGARLSVLIAGLVLAGCSAGGDVQAVQDDTAPVATEQGEDASAASDDAPGAASEGPATRDSTDDALETAQSPSGNGAELTAVQEAELHAQQDAERAEAAEVLELPPGAQFGPPEVFTEPAWYQEGFFASLMAIDWRCAWLSTGVKQVNAGNLAEATESVEVLHSFTESTYIASFPDYDYVLDEFVDPLLDGDTSAAESYLSPRNCPDSTLVH